MMTVADKIGAIRKLMKQQGIDAYIIPDSDPHQSEYPPDCYRMRTWVSGFSGSMGTVVVTADTAGLWTDSRYYLAAAEALAGTPVTLFRDGSPGVPTTEKWIAGTLARGSVVAFDDATYSVAAFRSLDRICREQRIEVRPGVDLISEVWKDRPALPSNPVFLHDTKYAGQPAREKIDAVRAALKADRADVFLTAALDEVAWLFNLRGADVAYNPVFMSFAAVTDREALLFIDGSKVPADVRAAVEGEGVTLRDYTAVESYLRGLDPEHGISLCPQKLSLRLYALVPSGMRIVDGLGPVNRLKARKNATEQEHLRKLMVRDAVAMEKFFYWLSQSVPAGGVTEISAAKKLREIRARDDRFVGESFNTIAGYRGHGAIVHYASTAETDVELRPEGLLLLDSGGQYLDGTTDITRVAALGTPTKEERRDYTLVLKAHIALATARFPKGTTGAQLDTISRDTLWRHGLGYGHGTGHGVGFFLNVHEGPQKIAPTGDSAELEPGMYTSNEPGVYREGKHGVRVENLVLVQSDGATDFSEFYAFETITLCHIEPELVDSTMLNAFEKSWLNSYQHRVFDLVSRHLEPSEREWLRSKTAEIPLA